MMQMESITNELSTDLWKTKKKKKHFGIFIKKKKKHVSQSPLWTIYNQVMLEISKAIFYKVALQNSIFKNFTLVK